MLTSSTCYRRCPNDLFVLRCAGRTNPSRTAGTRICVRGGAFSGMTGNLLHQPPDRPAIVQVEVLGRPVDLEIDPRLLERC